jgi:putative hydrolase of the HAD superfamily
MTSALITTIFLDIGGVLLTKGWGHELRKKTADLFHLDYAELDTRHHLTYDTFESGKLSLEEYLDRVVFYEPRPFVKEEIISFIFEQSAPFQQMIDLMSSIRKKYRLKIAVVSNEARELSEFRIHKFGLGSFVDFFICSCFVHLRKPDTDIYRIALDVSQAPPEQVLYVEDRAMFVQVAQKMGIRGIHHTDFGSTRQQLAALGFSI